MRRAQTLPKIKGVRRERRRRANGRTEIEHYTRYGAGAKRFWTTPRDGFDPIAYVDAYKAASEPAAPRSELLIGQAVGYFFASTEFRRLAARTQSDYRVWGERFAERFADAPLQLLEEPRFRAKVMEWRDRWAHSPKQAQYAWTVAKRIASWAQDRGLIARHVLLGGTGLYKARRAELVWTADDVSRFCAVAPNWVQRILITAISTGLRVGDLCRLSRRHLEGGAIRIKTSKTGAVATIPILSDMRRLIEQTPATRELLLVSERGRTLTPHRASEGVRQWSVRAGVNPDLRLHDARGTAATRLIQDGYGRGVTLGQVAAAMGWSVKYTLNVIEHYVAADPEGAAGVAVIIERERTEKATHDTTQTGVWSNQIIEATAGIEPAYTDLQSAA